MCSHCPLPFPHFHYLSMAKRATIPDLLSVLTVKPQSMKTSLRVLLIALTFYHADAQQMTTVYGQIIHPKGKQVYLRYYQDYIAYEEITADSAALDKKGNFRMEFIWERPYPVTFFHGDEITEMFLSPGDSLRLTLDTKQFDETVVYEGRGAEVNNYLAQKTLTFGPMSAEPYKLLEKEFLAYDDSMTNARFQFFTKHFSKTPVNNPSFQAFKDYELEEIYYQSVNLRISYPQLHPYLNRASGQKVVSEKYYDFLGDVPPYDESAILSPSYFEYLVGHVDKEISKIYMQDTTQSMTDLKSGYIEEKLSGDIREYIYAYWIYDLLIEQRDIGEGVAVLDRFRQASPGSRYVPMLEETLLLTSSLAPGSPAPDFTCLDTEGKEVSLSDFRGKIVYMDIWATWCGPCRSEIPHAEKLGDEMRNEDVVFLCVSIDGDENAWKEFVKKKNMHGVHVLSEGEFNSPVSTRYGVTGIPHYILIDREGKIVNSNAGRPSMGAKEEIEALLD